MKKFILRQYRESPDDGDGDKNVPKNIVEEVQVKAPLRTCQPINLQPMFPGNLNVNDYEELTYCSKCGSSEKKESAPSCQQSWMVMPVFICKKCDFPYTPKTAVKLFKCCRCERTFDTKSNILWHQRSECDVVVAKKAANWKKVTVCDICEKQYSCKKSLKKHLIQMHFQVRPHDCTLCGEKFKQKIHLTRHIHRKHYKVRVPTLTKRQQIQLVLEHESNQQEKSMRPDMAPDKAI